MADKKKTAKSYKRFAEKAKVQEPKYPAKDLAQFTNLTDYETRKLFIKDKISPRSLYTREEFEKLVNKRFGNRR